GGLPHAEPTVVLRATSTNTGSDPLPTAGNDRSVTDDDDDGKPAVTVQLSGIVNGQIYLVQRRTSRLDRHATEGGFHGRIRFTNEQKILDATSKTLRRDPRAKPDLKRRELLLHRVNA